VLTRHQVSKDAGLLMLRHENAVLRRQVGRVRCEQGDWLWLAALSRLVSRRRWSEVFMVPPAALLVWHRRLAERKWDYTSRRRPGRPSTAAAIRKLVIRIATDNPAWGTGGCRANWSGSASRSQRPRCGRSCTMPRSARRPAAPARAGSSSLHTGPRNPRGRLLLRRHHAAVAHLRHDRHRARDAPRSPGRRHRAPRRCVGDTGGP
jgi:hypothetical protein